MVTNRKPTQAKSEPVAEHGILANDHDVDRLAEDIQKLAAGLAERGWRSGALSSIWATLI